MGHRNNAPPKDARFREAGLTVRPASMAWRRNLQISDDLITAMRSAREDIEAPSDSDVVRRALTAYEQFVEDSADGIRMQSVRQNGEIVSLGDELQRAAERRGLAGDVTKVNLMFQEGSEQRFDAIKRKIGATTPGEVVEKALSFYIILLNEHFSGATLQNVYQHGAVETLRLVGLPRRPRSSGATTEGVASADP
jgi:hypothetical protein